MTDLAFFAEASHDKLAGLVMELAAQLHVERQQRLALEQALIKRGALKAEDLAALAADPAFRAQARAELDRSLAGLMRIVTEGGDAKTPLREE